MIRDDSLVIAAVSTDLGGAVQLLVEEETDLDMSRNPSKDCDVLLVDDPRRKLAYCKCNSCTNDISIPVKPRLPSCA